MFEEFKRIFGITDEASLEGVSSRTLGEQIPVSIGTALIIEAETAEVNKWSPLIMMNIMTLVRNIISSVPSSYQLKLQAKDIVNAVLEEMEILKQVIPEANARCQVDFYYPDYTTIFRGFPKANAANVKTPLQKYRRALYQDVYAMLKKKRDNDEDPFTYIACDYKLMRDNRDTTLFTHIPSDLLAQYNFPKLTLLESHTGRVKSRQEWSTKLNKNSGEDMSSIPFCKFTLQIYGDGWFFLTSDKKLKQYVKQMAAENNWTSMTTESRIRSSINKIKHFEDRSILLSYI